MMDTVPTPRGFSAELAIPEGAGGVDLEFAARLQDPMASPQALGHALDVFRRAVNAGMFGPRGLLEVRALGPGDHRVIQQQWRVEGLKPGAYRVLLNLIHAVHRHALPLVAIRLQPTATSVEMLGLQQVMAQPYPVRPTDPGFEVRLAQDVDEAKEPVIRLRFGRVLAEAECAVVEHIFRAWDDVVLGGGWNGNPDIEGSGAEHGAGQTYMAAPDTLEHVLYWDEIGDGAAFDALVSAAIRVSATVCPVAAFELE